MQNYPDEDETLRLVTAFFAITDPEARRLIVAIVEAMANGTITTETLRTLAEQEEQS